MAILDAKEFLLGKDTKPSEIKLEPRKGPPKEWSIHPGNVTVFAESVIFIITMNYFFKLWLILKI